MCQLFAWFRSLKHCQCLHITYNLMLPFAQVTKGAGLYGIVCRSPHNYLHISASLYCSKYSLDELSWLLIQMLKEQHRIWPTLAFAWCFDSFTIELLVKSTISLTCVSLDCETKSEKPDQTPHRKAPAKQDIHLTTKRFYKFSVTLSFMYSGNWGNTNTDFPFLKWPLKAMHKVKNSYKVPHCSNFSRQQKASEKIS